MRITIDIPDIPDKTGPELQQRWEDLPRHAMEVLVADAYRHELLTAAQVRKILGPPSRFGVDVFLKDTGAYFHYTPWNSSTEFRGYSKYTLSYRRKVQP